MVTSGRTYRLRLPVINQFNHLVRQYAPIVNGVRQSLFLSTTGVLGRGVIDLDTYQLNHRTWVRDWLRKPHIVDWRTHRPDLFEDAVFHYYKFQIFDLQQTLAFPMNTPALRGIETLTSVGYHHILIQFLEARADNDSFYRPSFGKCKLFMVMGHTLF